MSISITIMIFLFRTCSPQAKLKISDARKFEDTISVKAECGSLIVYHDYVPWSCGVLTQYNGYEVDSFIKTRDSIIVSFKTEYLRSQYLGNNLTILISEYLTCKMILSKDLKIIELKYYEGKQQKKPIDWINLKF